MMFVEAVGTDAVGIAEAAVAEEIAGIVVVVAVYTADAAVAMDQSAVAAFVGNFAEVPAAAADYLSRD